MIAGFCAALLGLVLSIKFVGYAVLAGMAISCVGLAVYARARGHSIAYGAWALIPLPGVGPLAGLLYLSLRSPRTTNNKSPWKIPPSVVFIVLFYAIFGGFILWGQRKVTAFYASAKRGVSLVEVIDKHGGWIFIKFGEKFSEDSYPRSGRADCGSVSKGSNEPMLFSPPSQDPTQKQSSYRNLRDIVQTNPQLFTKCPIVSVTYPTGGFQSGTIDVQVDAQGKIILVKDPRYYD